MKRNKFFILLIIFSKVVSAQSVQTREDSIKKYFIANESTRDPIEGLWDVVSTSEYYIFDTLYDVVKKTDPERIVIVKKENKCAAFYLSGESFNVEFSPTDVKGVYLYRNFFPPANQYSESHAVINKSGVIEYTYDLPESETKTRTGNKFKEGMRVVNILKWTKVF